MTEIEQEEAGRWRLFLISQDPLCSGDLEVCRSGYRIGRDAKAADGVVISNPGISRLHCRIDSVDNGYAITDLDSRNGTKLNEEPILPGQPYHLANGDIISIAGTEYAVLLKYESSRNEGMYD